MAIGDKITFNYTGALQTYTVPAGVVRLKLETWGAEGGQRTANRTSNVTLGGKGGYAKGVLAVTPGQVLNIYVGGQGGSISGADNQWSGGSPGWNGGGWGGTSATSSYSYQGGAGGGGASDIRIGGTALTDRVIVGGGGAGATYNLGGAGGGLEGSRGGDGAQLINGGGGTQTAGGTVQSGSYTGQSGTSGNGGNGGGGNISNGAGGGGGGYYGGAGGTDGGGGGGGSSYYGTLAEPVTTTGARSLNGTVVLTIDANDPGLTPASQSLGTKDSKDNLVSYTASRDAASGVSVTSIVEKLNGSIIRTLTNPATLTQTISLSQANWDALLYADKVHTLNVVVTDSQGRTASSDYTFSKRVPSSADTSTVLKAVNDLELFTMDKKERVRSILASHGEPLVGTEKFNALLDLVDAYKYRDGTRVPFTAIEPKTPMAIVNANIGGTYNQQINYKYASEETGNMYFPQYDSGAADPIYLYNADGVYIGSFSYNRTLYGTVYGLIEYNNSLFVFGSLGIAKYNVTTRTLTTGVTGTNFSSMAGSRVIRRGTSVYHASSAGAIKETNIDTLTNVRQLTLSLMTGITDIDTAGNFYGGKDTNDLVKYNSAGTLMFNVNPITYTVNHNYRHSYYSVARGTIFTAAYDYTPSRMYLYELSATDGSIIRSVDLFATFGVSGRDTEIIGIVNGIIVFKENSWIFFIKEDDLSLAHKQSGLIYQYERGAYVTDKVLVGTAYINANTFNGYMMSIKLT